MPNQQTSSNQRQALHEYLVETRDNMAQYHARKENMAWVATTIYLGGLLALINQVFKDGLLIWPTALFKWGLTAVIVITAAVTLAFIRKQLQDRTAAAHIIASCGEVLGQLVDPEFKITGQLLRAHEWEKLGHYFVFPKILVERLRSPIRQSKRLLWNYLSPYLAIIMWTIAFIVLVWCI